MIRQIIGHYKILEKIGEGGMGVVYKALDTRLEREVAIKFMLRERVRPDRWDDFRKRLEREARALAKLSHPNIVSILDYGEHDGEPYIIMEYLSGGSLAEKLGKKMPWRDAVSIILFVARGLELAHQRGMLHRDIKPSNILFSEFGIPKLADFGLVKILDGDDKTEVSHTTVGMGTASYMSPEQASGRQVDERSDIYSLGTVFFELVTGRKPFLGETAIDVLLKQVNEPHPRPGSLEPGLPVDIDKAICKALEKLPENRFPTIGKMIEALAGIPVAPMQNLQRESKQKRVWVGMLLLVGMISAVVLAKAAFWPPQSPEILKTTTPSATITVEKTTFLPSATPIIPTTTPSPVIQDTPTNTPTVKKTLKSTATLFATPTKMSTLEPTYTITPESNNAVVRVINNAVVPQNKMLLWEKRWLK